MRKRTIVDDAARDELFGMSRSHSSFFLSEDEEGSTSLGGNLHDLSDRQINKLLHIKFKDNPIELIRQLSHDLTSKEQELILLRKEQFTREQELLRLLNEYGNLSSLEIDKKLNNLKIDKKVDKVLEDLIDNAMHEDLPRPLEPKPTSPQLHASLPPPPDETKPTWLSTWYGSEDKVFAKFFSDFKLMKVTKPAASTTSRVPVELDNFVDSDADAEKEDIDKYDTDKYGFFHDVNNLVIKKPVAADEDPGISQHQSYEKLKELGELHDAKNLNIEKQWDKFLRQVNKVSRHAGDKSGDLAHEQTFGLKGLNLITGHEKVEDDSSYRQLQKLIQMSGIPPKYRHHLWQELSGATNLKIPGEYNQLIQISTESHADLRIANNLNQVKLDLHRTLPSNIYFNDLINSKPGPIYYKLQRILHAYIVYKPTIGYCQGMNKIVGNLLLGVNKFTELEEENVFWIFVALTEEILPHYKTPSGKILNFFDTESIDMVRIDQQIMIDHFFPKVMPTLYHHLMKLNVQIEFITLNWWLSVFTENFLNLDIWLKIFDNLLISDHSDTQLMSLTLSTFKIFENLLLSLHTSDEVYLVMKNLNRNNATKMNLKFSEIFKSMQVFDKKVQYTEVQLLRGKYQYSRQ